MRYVTFSLDDAMLNQHEYGLRLMQEYGFRGTLGVVTGRVGQTYSHTPAWHVQAMTWGQIADFSAAGWEIASHSRHHRSVANSYLNGPYASLNGRELLAEVVGAKTDLQHHGYAPTTFIRPGSFFQNPPTIPEAILVREHYEARRLYYSGAYDPSHPFLNSLAFPLPHDLLAVHLISYEGLEKDLRNLLDRLPEESWVIFCVHGIDEPLGGSVTITPQDFELTLHLVKESEILVVPIDQGILRS
ncbi:MAG TPA: polysaccharide deacetylase family protein [Candidatus Nanoarchaeia archaeon]|nr:polysaccharide deacetylase family protein [Candidatus Nanoarchaeia archaeon]